MATVPDITGVPTRAPVIPDPTAPFRVIHSLPAFDPAAWLADFEAAGGWWAISPQGRITLGWTIVDIDDEPNTEAQQLWAVISADPIAALALRTMMLAEYGEARHA